MNNIYPWVAECKFSASVTHVFSSHTWSHPNLQSWQTTVTRIRNQMHQKCGKFWSNTTRYVFLSYKLQLVTRSKIMVWLPCLKRKQLGADELVLLMSDACNLVSASAPSSFHRPIKQTDKQTDHTKIIMTSHFKFRCYVKSAVVIYNSNYLM